jgi:hypothetical protein
LPGRFSRSGRRSPLHLIQINLHHQIASGPTLA